MGKMNGETDSPSSLARVPQSRDRGMAAAWANWGVCRQKVPRGTPGRCPCPHSHIFANNQSVHNPWMGLVISEESPEPALWTLCSFALKKILQADPYGDRGWAADVPLERTLREAGTHTSWLHQESFLCADQSRVRSILFFTVPVEQLGQRTFPCPQWGKCLSCLQGCPVCPGVQSMGRGGWHVLGVWQSTTTLSTATWPPVYRQEVEEERSLHCPTWRSPPALPLPAGAAGLG